jgi:hypothetical protein
MGHAVIKKKKNTHTLSLSLYIYIYIYIYIYTHIYKWTMWSKAFASHIFGAWWWLYSLLHALITFVRIVLKHKHGFSSVTVQLASYGFVWQVWMQSLEVVICSFGLCGTVWNRLGVWNVPLSQIFKENLIIYLHLLCSFFSINFTLFKLSLAISLWTSAAAARFRAVDGHPPRVSPWRAITFLSQSLKLFRDRCIR